MLNEKKPSERLADAARFASTFGVDAEAASQRDTVRHILDELHAFCLTLQRAQTPSAGVGVKGDAKRDPMRLLVSFLEHNESDDERWSTEAVSAELRPIVSALEAERASHREIYRDYRVALQNEKDARAAEQRAHNSTKEQLRSVAECHCEAEETIAQLQRDLAERTGSLGDSLRESQAELADWVSVAQWVEGAMAQLRDMRVSLDDAKRELDAAEKLADGQRNRAKAAEHLRARLKEEQANCDAAEQGMRALLDSEGPGQALIGARATQKPERCDAHDCIAPAMHEIVNRGQHVAHFCDTHWLRLDARLGDIAALVKDGCHPEIAASRVESGAADPGSNDDPLVILREMLHDGWDDDALSELRRVIASLRNERNSSAAELTAARLLADGLDSKLTAIRVALTNAGVPEVVEYPEDPSIDERERSLRTGGRALGYVERIERLIADRDRLQAELATVRGELEEANRQTRGAAKAAGYWRSQAAGAFLRAQSSDGLRAAVVAERDRLSARAGGLTALGNEKLRMLSRILAAHPAPSVDICAADSPADGDRVAPSGEAEGRVLTCDDVGCDCPRATFCHDLKTWPEYFDAIEDGLKPWEYRKDDREPKFNVGDTLLLRRWDPKAETYSGAFRLRQVTYVARGGLIPEGYCVMTHLDPLEVRHREQTVTTPTPVSADGDAVENEPDEHDHSSEAWRMLSGEYDGISRGFKHKLLAAIERLENKLAVEQRAHEETNRQFKHTLDVNARLIGEQGDRDATISDQPPGEGSNGDISDGQLRREIERIRRRWEVDTHTNANMRALDKVANAIRIVREEAGAK